MLSSKYRSAPLWVSVTALALVARTSCSTRRASHEVTARITEQLLAEPPLPLNDMWSGSTRLQRWLMADYGLTERGAQVLMGQAAEYEVANVVDPNFTVVAKISKALLPSTLRR